MIYKAQQALFNEDLHRATILRQLCTRSPGNEREVPVVSGILNLFQR